MHAYYRYTTPRKGAKIQRGKWVRTRLLGEPPARRLPLYLPRPCGGATPRVFITQPYHSFIFLSI